MSVNEPRGVVITGGAAGIGWATACRFAAQGDRVAILDRDGDAAAAAAAKLGGEHFALQVDVSDEAALIAAIATAHTGLGRLDVLVNNAATIYSGGGPSLTLDLAGWRKLVAVNVSGVQVAAREAVAIMRMQETGGAIVNLASLAGIVAVPERTAYSASKAAVIGLTNILAGELATDPETSQIRVNAVLPGFTATETYREAQRQRGSDSSGTDRRIPLGRMGEPDEIAAAVVHLASPDASAAMGVLLAVDGGFQVYGGVGDAAVPGAVRPTPAAGRRVAVVSGANGPIGTALVARLERSGMRVVSLDRTDCLSDELMASAVAQHARVDLLVYAGEDAPSNPTGAEFDDDVVTALKLAQAFAPAMIRQGNGAIVNLCSPASSAAQEMMAMLSRSLACEWAKHGIRVNAVIPGLSARMVAGVAAAIDFLGSDDASYITGATYRADGGVGRS